MNHEQTEFVLSPRGAARCPLLTGVKAHGRLDGVLFELTLQQRYKNDGDTNLEVIYTFPLPYQATLLGFASELNGQRMEGRVVAKAQAEREYEEALSQGDAPVMLEALGNGLHTANLGNLKPGDEISIELRFAQILCFEQGRLRLCIPTTIAPRYGQPASAGLQPQQAPQASITAAYPLDLAVSVEGDLRHAQIECPTHRMTRSVEAECLRLQLAQDAWMDRDVVFTVQPTEAHASFVLRAEDAASEEAPVVLMAAMQAPAGLSRSAAAIKLLVDCSGSMAGDSIASARAVIQGALDLLGDADAVSLSRFGSSVEQVFPPSACTASTRRRLKGLVNSVDANMGGTEMAAALSAVFALAMPAAHASADVLLLTDGEIWEIDPMIAAARQSQHRIFIVGLGASPAEAVLRRLAEATGGAAEFATPGETLEAAARRMLARMRQQPYSAARLDWGVEPLWQTALPPNVFGGDSVVAFAGFARLPEARASLVAVDGMGKQLTLASAASNGVTRHLELTRVAAARRLASAQGNEALLLATRYQLLSAQTNYVLVHTRADSDKTTTEAELHQVESMLAAGWGGTSTVAVPAAAAAGSISFSRAQPMMVHATAAPYAASSFDDAVPMFSRRQADDPTPDTLAEIAAFVAEQLREGGRVQDLAADCCGFHLHAEIEAAFDELSAMAIDIDLRWLLLAHWVNTRRGGLADQNISAVLRGPVQSVSAPLVARALETFERILGSYSNGSWTQSRARRLMRSLANRIV